MFVPSMRLAVSNGGCFVYRLPVFIVTDLVPYEIIRQDRVEGRTVHMYRLSMAVGNARVHVKQGHGEHPC